MAPLLPPGSAHEDAPAPNTSPGAASRLLRGLRRAEGKAAPKQGSAGNCCGKPPSSGPHGSPSLRQRVETSTARPTLSLSRRPWEDGAAAVARGSWLAGSRLAAPTRPGERGGGGDTPRGWGRSGSTHQGDLEEQGQMPVAQGWYPASCRSGHSFLCIFRSISLMRRG